MHAPREYDLTEDWKRLRRASGSMFRRPLTAIVITLSITCIVVALTLSKTPTFVATASLRVGDELSKSPVLEELDIPTGTTDVGEALTVLASYDLAASLVEAPTDGELATPDHPEYARRMGLTTWVEDEGRAPLKTFFRGLTGDTSADFRLFAALEPMSPDAARQIRVRFVDGDRCVLSHASGAPGIEWPENEPEIFAYEPGRAMHFAGLRVRVETRGVRDDRSFSVERLTTEDAAVRVQQRVQASARTGFEGLVRVRVEDTHPVRAAEIARSVIDTYMELDVAATLERADRAIEYVERELVSREGELAVIDREIARILELFPDAIEIDKAFTQLNQRQTATSTDLARVSRLRRSLQDVDELVRAGDRASVSRLGSDLDDPVARRYLEFIGVLEDERTRVAREGPGMLTSTLQIKLADDERLRAQLESKLIGLDLILAGLAAGDRSVLGRLGEENAKEGAVTVDALTLHHIGDYAKTERRALEFEATFTSEYYAVRAARREMAAILERVVAHLGARQLGLEAELAAQEAIVNDWRSLRESHPEDELARIDAAIESHWALVERAIAKRVDGVRDQENALLRELDTLRSRIGQLPGVERLLKDPLGRREALDTVVAKLRTKREDAAIARAGALPNARLIDPARAPRTPASPSVLLALLVGLLLGGTAAVMWTGIHTSARQARLSGTGDEQQPLRRVA
ncbi:MAG: hypothetical protein GY711_34840 [bacterium]|nr:hypothetical protein [bacterium]